MSQPRVSVCIPVYNGAEFIAQAIESVLAQSFMDFELVILDNASIDGTLDVASRFADPRIRVERNQATTGAGANWNRALRAARGEFVKLVSADDYLYEQCLERQLEGFVAGGENVVLVTSPRDIVDESGRRLMTRGLSRFGLVRGSDARRRVVRSGTNPLGETASALMRASAVERVGGFDESDPYTIDVDYWMRLLETGDLFVVDGPLSAYRVSAGSWSASVAGSQAAHYRKMLDVVALRPGSNLSAVDLMIGRAMASINGLARQVVYALRPGL